MKAIILAAGQGTRLRPFTYHVPKCMVMVNKTPMLQYQIDALLEGGVKEIAICVGYKGGIIKKYINDNYSDAGITIVANETYDTTNNMYSLYLARDFLSDDCIILNGDVVFDPEIIRGLMMVEGSVIACQEGVYMEESMKLVVQKGQVVDIAKTITEADAFATSIDVYKFAKAEVAVIKKGLLEIIEGQKKVNEWTELLFQKLFKERVLPAKPYDIKSHRWLEIDTLEDLYMAEGIFSNLIDDVRNKKLFFIDRDGTLTLQGECLPETKSFLAHLNATDRNFFVLSNNSSRTPKRTAEIIQQSGVDITEERLLLSTDSLITYLRQEKITHIYLVAPASVQEYFQGQGFTLTDQQPYAVVLTYDTEIQYEKIVTATHLLHSGIPYYATHIDHVCPTTKGSIPDIGTFITMFKTATNRDPDKIFGKPSPHMVLPVLRREGYTAKDAVIIGDRMYTDIALGENTDIMTVLTLTGEAVYLDALQSKYKPDIIVPSLDYLETLLQS